MVRVANELRPGATLQIGPAKSLFSLLGWHLTINKDDASSALMALLLLSNNLRDHEQKWADQLRRVMETLYSGTTIRIGRATRPFSADNAEDFKRAARLVALIDRYDIIGGNA